MKDAEKSLETLLEKFTLLKAMVEYSTDSKVYAEINAAISELEMEIAQRKIAKTENDKDTTFTSIPNAEEPSQKIFIYQVLRFTRSIITEEFINVAIVLYDVEDKKVYTKHITSTKRLRNFFPNIDCNIVMETIVGICNSLESKVDINEYKKLIGVNSKATMFFSLSDEKKGITTDPLITLNNLFDKMVSAFDKNKIENKKKKIAMLTERSSYLKRLVMDVDTDESYNKLLVAIKKIEKKIEKLNKGLKNV